MTKQARTTDEKLILALYEAAKNSGELSTRFNRYNIGKAAGIQPKGVDAICKLLIQANFIKKEDPDFIYITPHGESLAKRLLEERH